MPIGVPTTKTGLKWVLVVYVVGVIAAICVGLMLGITSRHHVSGTVEKTEIQQDSR